MRRIIIIMALMLVMIVANVCEAMQIRMLNIGQGDSILIQTDNKNILIDTADAKERDKLKRELTAAGVVEIDTLILTHAHADHIGNASWLIRHYGVRAVYDNGYPSASKYARSYLAAVKDNGLEYHKVQGGDVIELDESVEMEIVYPAAELDNLSVNNQSLVGRLVYGKFRMLFTGDVEAEGETEMLYGNAKIASTVLKAAHHGSGTSSLYNFVEAVHPSVVLISAGVGNRYKHPHKEAVAAYLAVGVKSGEIYSTAQNGTIIIETDGKDYTITPAVKNNWASEYVGEKTLIRRARRIS